MLTRVLEPEVMDSDDEARDYDSMDHATVNRVFVVDFLAAWHDEGTILDVGTGTAQIPIELCRTHPSVHVVGIDLSEAMLRIGQANIQQASLQDRVRLERCDAKHLPFAPESLAAVVSNSIVHHIPSPLEALAEIVRVVRHGGTIFVRDLLRPEDDANVRLLVATYASEANAHQRKMFDDSLRAALSLAEIRALVTKLDCDPAEVYPSSDRHWTWRTRIIGERSAST